MSEVIPDDILKIQKKLAYFEKDLKNNKKDTKILAKHIKTHTMQKRVQSHIKVIETVQTLNEE